MKYFLKFLGDVSRDEYVTDRYVKLVDRKESYFFITRLDFYEACSYADPYDPTAPVRVFDCILLEASENLNASCRYYTVLDNIKILRNYGSK